MSLFRSFLTFPLVTFTFQALPFSPRSRLVAALLCLALPLGAASSLAGESPALDSASAPQPGTTIILPAPADEILLVPPTVSLGEPEPSTAKPSPLAPIIRAQTPSALAPTHELAASAAPPCDVWLIDARAACGCFSAGETPKLRYFKYAAGNWESATLESFTASSDPTIPTVFWVHGNRVEYTEVSAIGWNVYQQFHAAAGQPFRFVIWSWPASQIRGQVKDIRAKATRADQGGYPLAWVVSRLAPEQSVGLVGYSFGARLIAGALHTLTQGDADPDSLPADVHATRSMHTRAVLWAAAIDNDAMATWGYRHLAPHAVSEMLITVNCADPALKWYHRLWGRGGPDALGYTGPLGLGDQSHILTMNVSGTVGKTHDWEAYAYSPRIMAATAATALGPAPLAPAAEPAPAPTLTAPADAYPVASR